MKPTRFFIALSLTLVTAFGQSSYKADVIVYGGTSAGVIEAVKAKKMGKSVILVSSD